MRKKEIIIGAFLGLGTLISQAQTTVNFTVENPCIGEPAILTSASSSSNTIVDYKWDVDNDGVFDEYEGPSVVTPTFPIAQTWRVGLKVYLNTGDSAEAYQDVVITNVPVAGFSSNEKCINDEVLFTNASTLQGGNITRVEWRYGDGTSEELVGNPSKKYANAVSYDVTQIVESAALCRDTLTKTITLDDAPSAQITAEMGVTEIAVSQDLNLSLNESVANSNWSTGESTNQITINQPGTYFVTGEDLNGCNYRDTVEITQISNKKAVYNAFSPNGDGQNDFWKIKNIELYNRVDVKVFDKRGALVFEQNAYQNNWEGDFNGNKLPEGVYYYQVVLNGDTGNTLRGTLTILSAE